MDNFLHSCTTSRIDEKEDGRQRNQRDSEAALEEKCHRSEGDVCVLKWNYPVKALGTELYLQPNRINSGTEVS